MRDYELGHTSVQPIKSSRKLHTVVALLIYLLIALASSLVAFTLAGAPPDIEQSRNTGLIAGVIVIPFFETFIHLVPTGIAGHFASRIIIAAAVGSLPFALAHCILGWLRGVFIWPQVAWLSYCYLRWRADGVLILNAATRVWLIHAFGNLVALIMVRQG